MEYEVEGARPRGRPRKTWREIVEKDCQVRGLNREDAMDCSRWMKQLRDNWWPRYVLVGECFFWYQLTRVVPDKILRAVKWLCVYVCMWWTFVAVAPCVCPSVFSLFLRFTLPADACVITVIVLRLHLTNALLTRSLNSHVSCVRRAVPCRQQHNGHSGH